jgi:hypothetical protein
MSILKKSDNLSNLDDPSKFRFIEVFLKEVRTLINGNLQMSTNISMPFVEVLFENANADVSVAHNLGRIPRGYFVIEQTAGAVVYTGGGVATATTINLKATTSTRAKLVFF